MSLTTTSDNPLSRWNRIQHLHQHTAEHIVPNRSLRTAGKTSVLRYDVIYQDQHCVYRRARLPPPVFPPEFYRRDAL